MTCMSLSKSAGSQTAKEGDGTMKVDKGDPCGIRGTTDDDFFGNLFSISEGTILKSQRAE